MSMSIRLVKVQRQWHGNQLNGAARVEIQGSRMIFSFSCLSILHDFHFSHFTLYFSSLSLLRLLLFPSFVSSTSEELDLVFLLEVLVHPSYLLSFISLLQARNNRASHNLQFHNQIFTFSSNYSSFRVLYSSTTAICSMALRW